MLSNALSARFADAGEQRYTDRRILRLDARVSSGASSDVAQVHNISHTGMLVESDGTAKVGDTIEVELGAGQVHRATVVWADDNLFGCRFDEAISQGALSAALLRSAPSGATTPVVVPVAAQQYRISEALRDYAIQQPSPYIEGNKLALHKRMWLILGLALAGWAVPAAAAYILF